MNKVKIQILALFFGLVACGMMSGMEGDVCVCTNGNLAPLSNQRPTHVEKMLPPLEPTSLLRKHQILYEHQEDSIKKKNEQYSSTQKRFIRIGENAEMVGRASIFFGLLGMLTCIPLGGFFDTLSYIKHPFSKTLSKVATLCFTANRLIISTSALCILGSFGFYLSTGLRLRSASQNYVDAAKEDLKNCTQNLNLLENEKLKILQNTIPKKTSRDLEDLEKKYKNAKEYIDDKIVDVGYHAKW